MKFKKLKALGTFDRPLRDDCLIQCPFCSKRYGIKKWLRIMKTSGLVCPACGTLFNEKDTLFMVSYFERISPLVTNTTSTIAKKVSAKGSVKVIDKLIKKGE